MNQSVSCDGTTRPHLETHIRWVIKNTFPLFASNVNSVLGWEQFPGLKITTSNINVTLPRAFLLSVLMVIMAAVIALNQIGIEVVDAKLTLEQARVIKSSDELVCMKAAIEVAEIGVTKMRNELKAGMTEDELWSILHKTNIEHGGEWIECRILSSGERTNPWMQESSNKVIQSGEIVAFDTDMVGPYGYCADISRTFVEGHRFNNEQKQLYKMATDHINHNARLIKDGVSFREFTEKSWKLPKEYYGNRYSCVVHGIGLCDEWPQIKYPTDGGQREGCFEKNMTITLETYIGKVGGLSLIHI